MTSPSSLSALTLCVWNAQGVAGKKLELLNSIDDNQDDIMLITETHLSESRNFSVPNYDVYRSDRTRGKGSGAMILIKQCIPSCYKEHSNDNLYEYVTITTKLNKYGKINITCIYNPPRNIIPPAEFMNIFKQNEK